ncbi:MAG: HNH endonuclease [Planctomycetia bacterium]
MHRVEVREVGGDLAVTEEILKGLHPYYQTLKLKHRLIREKIFEYECSSCGISDWNGKAITLQLDHINGDSSDHRKDNLQLLCPNCHSQTETWCGRNK